MFTFHQHQKISVSISFLFIFLFVLLILPGHANSQTVVTGCAGGDFADECSLAEFNAGASISIGNVKFSFSTQVFPNPLDQFGTDPSQVKVLPLEGAPGPGLRIQPNSGVWSVDGNGTLFATKSSQTYIFFALPVDGVTPLDIVDVNYNVESTTSYPAVGDPLCASGPANSAGGHVEGLLTASPGLGGPSLGGVNYAGPQVFVDDVNTNSGEEIFKPAQGTFSFADQFGVQILHTLTASDCGTSIVNSAEITAYEIRVVLSEPTPVVPGNDVLGNLPGSGVVVFQNDNTSSVTLDPDVAMAIAVADVDGNGVDDVIASFLAGNGPGGTGGTFISRNQGALVLLDSKIAEQIAVGNFDGTDGDDLMLDFGVDGLWFSLNDGVVTELSGESPVTMAVGDTDNSGQDDVVLSLNSSGTINIRNFSVVDLLDATPADVLELADIDGNGQDDIFASFAQGNGPGGTGGLSFSVNQGALTSLTPLETLNMTSGDYDGSGQDDFLLDFGGGTGLILLLNGASAIPLGVLPVVAMASGDVDSNGEDDMLLSITGAGTIAFKNLTTVDILDPAVALDLATGNIDGN